MTATIGKAKAGGSIGNAKAGGCTTANTSKETEVAEFVASTQMAEQAAISHLAESYGSRKAATTFLAAVRASPDHFKAADNAVGVFARRLIRHKLFVTFR